MSTGADSRQKFDFPVPKNWFLCNKNSNYFHYKNMTIC